MMERIQLPLPSMTHLRFTLLLGLATVIAAPPLFADEDRSRAASLSDSNLPDTGQIAKERGSKKANKTKSKKDKAKGKSKKGTGGGDAPKTVSRPKPSDGSDVSVPSTSRTGHALTDPELTSKRVVDLSQGGSDTTKKSLGGRTIDFDYDGRDRDMIALSYSGRVYVPDSVLAGRKKVPLVVFFHGLNHQQIRHRWMGGGDEGDVRRIVSELISDGRIPPVIVAGPGSIQPEAVDSGSSFPVFDFDKFIALTKDSLQGVAEIDEKHIIVSGHSGAGCSAKGGIVSAVNSKFVPEAILSIDTCMSSDLGVALGKVNSKTNVIVTFQTDSWDRDVDVFKVFFDKGAAENPAAPGVRRTLQELPAIPGAAHDATVPQTFFKYLPELLPPT